MLCLSIFLKQPIIIHSAIEIDMAEIYMYDQVLTNMLIGLNFQQHKKIIPRESPKKSISIFLRYIHVRVHLFIFYRYDTYSNKKLINLDKEQHFLFLFSNMNFDVQDKRIWL